MAAGDSGVLTLMAVQQQFCCIHAQTGMKPIQKVTECA
jgi:hypothetical protein